MTSQAWIWTWIGAKTLHQSPAARRKESLILTIGCFAHRTPVLSSFSNLFDALTHPNLRVLQARYKKVAARGAESTVDTVKLFHGMPRIAIENGVNHDGSDSNTCSPSW
jgi:hypothetical protein